MTTESNMDDLQVDGAPISEQFSTGRYMHPTIQEKLMKMEHQTDKGREDSGIYSIESSMGYKSTGDLLSTDQLGDQMCKMAIEEVSEPIDNYSKTAIDDAPDDGYSSKSIDIDRPNIDRPWSSVEDTNASCASYSQLVPSAEALEAYCQDDDGDTQLHIAIIQLAEDIALPMINMAPNHDWLNLVNTLLQTPLHLAVITQQPTIVRRLMAAGAAIDTRDQNGNTPLHIASREGYESIIADLLTPVTYEETLENKYEIPFQRIPQDLQAKNYEGHTPLHLAAIRTHIPVMELLLNKKAKINSQDGKSGRTILHYAADTGNRILLQFLLRCRGLNLDSCTYGGLTPVGLAAGRKFGDVVDILAENGADTSTLLDEEEEEEDMIDDFCLNGEPLSLSVR